MSTLAPARGPAEVELLLGPEARDILAVAVDAAGGRLDGWRARQITHQPGHSTLVQYRAEVTWPDGRQTAETVVAATGARIPSGAAVLDDGGTRVAVWRWPHDPSLPGLAAALDRRHVGRLLGCDPEDPVHLRVCAYRPGRRAVVEATGRRNRLFLKVVRPATVEGLHRTHRALAAHVPVPDSLGWTDDGVVVLPALPGRTLRDALRAGRPVPAPGAVADLLDRLPAELAAGPYRRSTVAGARHQAAILTATFPAGRTRVEDVLAAIEARSLADHPVVPVHGDLYEAQLLVDDRGRITGLLDVDTAGAGARADDLANLCAHLAVLALVTDPPGPVRRYLDQAAWGADDDLRTRIAAAVLGLATGPFRVVEAGWERATVRRLDLAASWLHR
jgi:aminoglycoside phosphotransferase